jgi:putative membrane protein
MKISLTKGIIALTALCAGASAYALTPTPTYIAKAAAGDLYETQSSKIVLQTTKNAKVKSFATQMIADHAKSTGLVKAAATKSGIVPIPPTLDPSQKEMIASLTAAKGAARDTLYLQQQHMAHEQALALHQDYAATGDKPHLKAVAGQIVVVVKKHIATMPH